MYITVYIEYELLNCIKELKKLHLLSTKCYGPLYSSFSMTTKCASTTWRTGNTQLLWVYFSFETRQMGQGQYLLMLWIRAITHLFGSINNLAILQDNPLLTALYSLQTVCKWIEIANMGLCHCSLPKSPHKRASQYFQSPCRMTYIR